MKLAKKEQDIAFTRFRRQGIFEVNCAQASKKNPNYERERSAKVSKDISYCNYCFSFVSRKFWYTHLKNCQKHSCKKIVPIPVGLLKLPDEINISDDFRNNILSKFRSDKIGEICCSDPTILRVGSIFYNKEKRKVGKAVEVRKSVSIRYFSNKKVLKENMEVQLTCFTV